MWAGLANARKERTGHGEYKSNQSKTSKESLTKLLTDDKTEHKKFFAALQWFHSNIKCRNEAETKLKAQDFSKDGIFLIRKSTACPDDFVLSFTCRSRIIHFQVKYIPSIGLYSLSNNCDSSSQHFKDWLEKLITFYHSTNISNACKLRQPCPGGNLPPYASISQGPTNSLHKAIESKNKDLAIDILNHPLAPDVDCRNFNGSTALHLASSAGLTEVVLCLVSKGASVDVLDKEGLTALHLACLSNHAKVVHHLIVDGHANPQKRIKITGNVALHLAAQFGHAETVKTLLKLDVPCFPRNYSKITPYELALKNSFEECVKMLDNYKAPPAGTKKADWFHDKIDNRKAAEKILDQYSSQDGYFLVRKSSQADKLVLDVCFNKKQEHFVIESCMSAVFIGGGPLLPSLEHLIEYYSTYADGLPDTLSVAISSSGSLIPMTKHEGGIIEKKLSPAQKEQPTRTVELMILDKKKLDIGSELGHGEFGSVLRGKWKTPTGKFVPVAIKTLHEQHTAANKDIFLSEAKIMAKLDHPHIVKLIGICHGPPFMLVQELLSMGSLQDFLLDYPEKVVVDVDILLWAEEIADGMMYLEKEKFVHRDLATRNILLESKNIAKICDFGLSRAVGSSDYYKASQGGKWPVKWYAPESINYGTFSSSSDVWSFGITLWEMYSLGSQPYENMNGAQVIEFIEQKGRLIPPSNCPNLIADIMKNCWKYNELERPTFEFIYNEIRKFKGF